MILLLTDSTGHPLLHPLAQHLGQQARVYATDQFPQTHHLSVHGSDAWIDGQLDFEQVQSIYVHRFAPGAPAPELDPALVALSVATSRAALSDAIEGIFTVNDLQAAALAGSRLRQARFAQQAGLTVPETLVSNSAEVARDFLQTYGGRAVVRWLVPSLPPQEPGPGPHRAQLLTPDHLRSESRDFKSIPRLIQRYLEKRRDIRVVYLDGTLFAAALHNPESPSPDWRRDATRPWQACDLPLTVQHGIHELMQSLGLTLATLDLADDGHHLYFLDLNPFGEWFWMERALQMPLTRTLAEVLLTKR